MKNNQYHFIPKSKTLISFLYEFDNELFAMEEEIKYQKEEVEKWRNDLMKLQANQMKEGQKMIGDTIKALFAPQVEVLNPAGAMILAHIRDNCHTIEQVKEYVDGIFQRSIDQIKTEK